MSSTEIDKLKAGMIYATIPASVLGTTADVKVHYVEAGSPSAPPMMLVHGFATGWFMWKQVMPELAKDYHVFAIDLPGFGFSDKPKDFPYEPDGYGKTLMNFMDQKGIQKAILVGNSMGGSLSLWLAMYHPERVSRLVLVDAGGYPMKLPVMLWIATISWIRPIAKPLFGKWVIKLMLKYIFSDDSKVTPELVEEYGQPFETENAKDVLFWMFKRNDISNFGELTKNIPNIKVPTLVIWGENDRVIPIEHAHNFNRDIKDSEMVIIPQCSHCPQVDKPAEFLRAITTFLMKNP